MRRTQTRLAACLLTLALALSLPAPALAAEGTAPDREASAQSAATAAMTYGGAVSLQYALWEDGEITLSGHVGAYSKTENRALTEDTLYGIGSVSKVYTAAAVMRLAEQGKLKLDAPVTRYLPAFKMADPRYKDITVRMLLNHSSGLMGSSFENAMLFDDADPAATDELLERLAAQRLKADPGAYSVYCNDGFTLAELVVEAVSGKEFMDFVRAELLKPAGVEDTFAPGEDFDAGRLAKTYLGTDTRALPQDCLNIVGAGGLYATAEDLAAFGGALTGTKLLRASSLEAMAAPEYARGLWPEDTLDALAFGLGWDNVEWYPFHQSGIQALVKGGDTLYYHAGLVVLPEYRMAAAVLSSGGVSTYNQMAANRLLLDALAARGVTVSETAEPLPEAETAVMPAELAQNAGYYAATAAQYRVDVSADGKLTMHYLNYPTTIPDQTFAYHSDGTFRDATGAACVAFVTEDNGQTYLYQKAMAQLPGLGGLPVSNYAAVKLPENPVDPQVQAAWEAINSRTYLPVEEKYTSQTYLAQAAAGDTETPETAPGYVGALRIVDASNARYELQLPGTGGRDGQDITAYEEDGARWLSSGGRVFLAAEDAPALYTGGGWSYATIQPDGRARWFRVGDAAGKTMAVQLPEDAGFYVYDQDFRPVASSVLWGDASAPLPEGGWVVFAGDAGARFHLSFR